MDEAVDGGERHGGVGEDLAPFAERLVGGDQQGPALVARADQLEQHAGLRLVLGDIGEIIEDQQVIFVELGDRGFEGEIAAGELKLLHEVGGAGEQDAPALFDQGQTERRGQMGFASAGRPEAEEIGPFSIHASPAASACTWAFEIIGTAAKSKASRVFPGGNRASSRWRSKRRRLRSAISCSPSAARKRAAGQPSLSAVAASAAQASLMPGNRNSPSISSMRAASILSVAFMPRSRVDGDLVIDGEGGQRDDDEGQGCVHRTEAFDQRRKVRQDALVEIGLQREGEFGLAGAFMRECENPHHGAAGRPLTEPREQGLERQAKARRGKSWSR